MKYTQKPKCLDCGKELCHFGAKRCTKCSNKNTYIKKYPYRHKERINPDNPNGLWRYNL